MSKFTLNTLVEKIKADLYGGEDHGEIIKSLEFYIAQRASQNSIFHGENMRIAEQVNRYKDLLSITAKHLKDNISGEIDEELRNVAKKWLNLIQEDLRE